MTGLIKICGLSDPVTVQAAAASGATHAGFMHFEKSPRHVSLEKARTLKAYATRGLIRVAVFVNPDDETVAGFCEAVLAHAVQLHGAEAPDRVAEVKRRTGLPVIKALGVSARDDLAGAQDFFAAADMLLFDAKPAKDETRPGGHGVTFDWSLLDGFRSPLPWFLSGGLGPANVAGAIAATRAPGVDVSSGVEESKGVKNAMLIRQFCQASAAAFLASRSSAA